MIVLDLEDGRVETDPELINVVPHEDATGPIIARRTHADLCERYQQDAAKAKLREDARRFNAKARGR